MEGTRFSVDNFAIASEEIECLQPEACTHAEYEVISGKLEGGQRGAKWTMRNLREEQNLSPGDKKKSQQREKFRTAKNKSCGGHVTP